MYTDIKCIRSISFAFTLIKYCVHSVRNGHHTRVYYLFVSKISNRVYMSWSKFPISTKIATALNVAKRSSVRLYLQLFVGGLISYCVFVHVCVYWCPTVCYIICCYVLSSVLCYGRGKKHNAENSKDELHRPHQKPEVNSDVREGQSVPVSFTTPAMLLI
jgi:hypothetical protein